MEAEKSRKRRRYTRELKDQIIAECEAPGASVAKVALSHGINANIVHGWRKLAGHVPPPVVRPEFVPVAVAPAVRASVNDRNIELELGRGAVVIKMLWPMDATAELSAFTRELLR